MTRRDESHDAIQRDVFRITNGQVNGPQLLFVRFRIDERDEIHVEITIDIPLFALLDNLTTVRVDLTGLDTRLRKRKTPTGKLGFCMKVIAGADDGITTIRLDAKTRSNACDRIGRWIGFDDATLR